MNQYNHRQFNQPGTLIWLALAVFVVALLIIAGEVLYQQHVQNKRLREGRAQRRKTRLNDDRIFQNAEEARSDFS